MAEVDRGDWQAKFSPTNDLVKKPQVKLTAARQAIVADESHVVELEMGNDLEWSERAAVQSLKELESQLSRTTEKKILLEGEVGEKKTLSEEKQRFEECELCSRGDKLLNFQRRVKFCGASRLEPPRLFSRPLKEALMRFFGEDLKSRKYYAVGARIIFVHLM
ncbi:hypothetical protein FS837_003834 [Tulasnella sp. UAMH 9824]|nr:hypothetical protein FS837_003834 [Tulasnella sp. UAMH 9824]